MATQVPQTHSFIGPEEPSEASSFSTEKDQTYTGKGNSSRHELITDVLAVPTLRHDQNSEENLETSIGFQDMEHAVRETTPWSEVGAPLELRAGSEGRCSALLVMYNTDAKRNESFSPEIIAHWRALQDLRRLEI